MYQSTLQCTSFGMSFLSLSKTSSQPLVIWSEWYFSSCVKSSPWLELFLPARSLRYFLVPSRSCERQYCRVETETPQPGKSAFTVLTISRVWAQHCSRDRASHLQQTYIATALPQRSMGLCCGQTNWNSNVWLQSPNRTWARTGLGLSNARFIIFATLSAVNLVVVQKWPQIYLYCNETEMQKPWASFEPDKILIPWNHNPLLAEKTYNHECGIIDKWPFLPKALVDENSNNHLSFDTL